MIYKNYQPGEIFTAADANNLQSGGRLIVDTAADLTAYTDVLEGQGAIAADTGETYTYWGEWTPDKPAILQAGSATIEGNGTTRADVAVLFDRPFAVPPVVVVANWPGSTSVSIVGSAIAVTATGFTLRGQAANASNFSNNYTLGWIATAATQ